MCHIASTHCSGAATHRTAEFRHRRERGARAAQHHDDAHEEPEPRRKQQAAEVRAEAALRSAARGAAAAQRERVHEEVQQEEYDADGEVCARDAEDALKVVAVRACEEGRACKRFQRSRAPHVRQRMTGLCATSRSKPHGDHCGHCWDV